MKVLFRARNKTIRGSLAGAPSDQFAFIDDSTTCRSLGDILHFTFSSVHVISVCTSDDTGSRARRMSVWNVIGSRMELSRTNVSSSLDKKALKGGKYVFIEIL